MTSQPLTFPAPSAEPDELLAAARRAESIALQLAPPLQAAALTVLLAHLLGHPEPVRQPRPPLDTSVGMVEFLSVVQPQSHSERVVAIAYWHLRRHAGAVGTSDLVAAYSAAGVERPRNFPDVIAGCCRRGLLAEVPRRGLVKTWRCTLAGEQATEELV